MPVLPDTRIYDTGGGGRPSSGGPFQTLGALMKIKESQLAFQEQERRAEMQRRELEDDDATRHYLQQYERPEEAITQLYREGRSDAARKLSKNVYDERTAELNAYDAKLKSNGSRLEQAAQILGGVTDDASYQTARKAVLDLVSPIYGQAINDYLPTTYDPAKIKQIVAAGTSRAQQIQLAQQEVTNWHRAYELGLNSASDIAAKTGMPKNASASEWSPNGLAAQQVHQENLARILSQATNKVQWDDGLRLGRRYGVPEVVLERFGTWDDKNPERAPARAQQLGITLPQQLTADLAAENAETRRIQAETANIRARTAARAGGDGSGRPLTTVQRNAEEDRRDKDDEETEKWAHEQWEKERPTESTSFRYEDLTPETRKEYIQRRVKSHNKSRSRMQHLPPIEDAAQTASDTGDVAGYRKLQDEYANITQGLGKLEDLVLPPSPYRGQKTPEAIAYRRQRIAEIKAELSRTDLEAAAKRRLTKEFNDLQKGLR